MGWLYLIHFGDPTRFYVGATTKRPPHRRWAHLQKLRRKSGAFGASALMQAEFDRCGEEAFTFVKLRQFDVPELYEREAEMIQKLQPALNTRQGYAATGRELGIHPTTVRRRIGRGVDPSAFGARAEYGRAPYRTKGHEVGEGRLLTVKEIAAESGCSANLIYHRLAQGIRGKALLTKPSGRGRPRKA